MQNTVRAHRGSHSKTKTPHSRALQEKLLARNECIKKRMKQRHDWQSHMAGSNGRCNWPREEKQDHA